MTSILRWATASASLLFFLLPLPLAHADQACYVLFQKKDFLPAADCFEKAASALGESSSLSKDARVRKGRLWRNAILCLSRLIAATKNPTERAPVADRAVRMIASYQGEELYENRQVLNDTLALKQRLEENVGFGTVLIVTNSPQAKACLRAPGFEKCQTGALWTEKLRPGRYTVVVSYPSESGTPITRERSFELNSQEQKTVVVTPPVSDAQLTVVTGNPKAQITLTGAGIGTALTFTGALWTQKLKPGAYQVAALFPGAGSITKTVQVQAGQPSVLLFEPPGPPVLRVQSDPEGATVLVNGRRRGKTDIRLVLQPGSYTIALQKPCYLPQAQKIEAETNQEKNLDLKLERDPVYLRWLKDRQGAQSRRTLGWILIGGGVVLGGVAGGMHGVASLRHSEALQKRPSDFTAYSQLATEGNTFRTVGHIGVALGAATLGAGLIALLLSSPQDPRTLPCEIKPQEEEDALR